MAGASGGCPGQTSGTPGGPRSAPRPSVPQLCPPRHVALIALRCGSHIKAVAAGVALGALTPPSSCQRTSRGPGPPPVAMRPPLRNLNPLKLPGTPPRQPGSPPGPPKPCDPHTLSETPPWCPGTPQAAKGPPPGDGTPSHEALERFKLPGDPPERWDPPNPGSPQGPLSLVSPQVPSSVLGAPPVPCPPVPCPPPCSVPVPAVGPALARAAPHFCGSQPKIAGSRPASL